jgi:hypothetical protein
MTIEVGQPYVGKDGQWYYYTEADVRREKIRIKVAELLEDFWAEKEREENGTS